MKKLVTVVLALLVGAFAFAESYEVKGVTGKVNYADNAKSKGKPVTVGMTLSDESFVTLGENAKLVLSVEGKDVTLRIPKKGTVAELLATRNDVASSVSKKGKGTATAASRASDAMAEGELDD